MWYLQPGLSWGWRFSAVSGKLESYLGKRPCCRLRDSQGARVDFRTPSSRRTETTKPNTACNVQIVLEGMEIPLPPRPQLLFVLHVLRVRPRYPVPITS